MRHGPPWMRQGSTWAPPGARPSWWPENEPYPPRDWRRTRVRFMRRMVAFAFFAFLLFAFFVALFISLLLGTFGAIGGGGTGAFVLLAAFLFLVVSFNVARGVRRLIVPLGDLVDAAERVESGDYSVRVRERGPRDLRALSRAFNAMSARLEGSEAERRRLLADVTHELRTPLTVIQGNIEALIDGIRATDEAHLRAILEDTHVLARLVDDLRTISVAEAGALALHREPTDVAALARKTLASFAPEAERGGVELRVDASDRDVVADVDPLRTREIVSNLVANALRYTNRGGHVTIAVDGTPTTLTIEVRDDGAGIPPDVLLRVFERFSKSEGSPGAGLGLPIAKSLVGAHGGDISIESALGTGTTIRVTLPRERPA